MSRLVLFDTSLWIEIFRSGPLSNLGKKILASDQLVGVPTVVIFEIYRKILTSVSEDAALSATAYLKSFRILDLSIEVALSAADIAVTHKLPMADSFILAHARSCDAKLITLDNDFSGIEGAEILRKR